MSLLKSLEFVPGVKWFDTKMHNSLFQHSVFGAIIFLVVSNTGVYKIVKDIIFDVTGYKADGNTMHLIHAVVFAVIMYFGSLFILAPLLTEGVKNKGCPSGKKRVPKKNGGGYRCVDNVPADTPSPITKVDDSVIDLSRSESQIIGNVEDAENKCSSTGSITMAQQVPQWDAIRHGGSRPTKRALYFRVFGAAEQFEGNMGAADLASEYGGISITAGGNSKTDEIFTKCHPIEATLVLGQIKKDKVVQIYTTQTNLGITNTGKASTSAGNSNIMLAFSKDGPDMIQEYNWIKIPPDKIGPYLKHMFLFGKVGEKNSQFLSERANKDVQDFFDIAAINDRSDMNLYFCEYASTIVQSTITSASTGLVTNLHPGEGVNS